MNLLLGEFLLSSLCSGLNRDIISRGNKIEIGGLSSTATDAFHLKAPQA